MTHRSDADMLAEYWCIEMVSAEVVMGRLSIAIEDQLVEDVRRLSGAKTKREAFEIALTDYLRRRRLEELAGLSGSDIVDMGVDELEGWRAGAVPKGEA